MEQAYSVEDNHSIEDILCEAGRAGASDVHLVAGMPPKMRVGGALTEMGFSRVTSADTLDILLGIMPQALRDRFEERGECVFSFALPEGGRCRANVYKQKGSVALALRLRAEEALSAEELGIPEPLMELSGKESGLVLLAGASGSGKSTTLSAILNKISYSRGCLVVTLEDSVECLYAGGKALISQREIGADCGSRAEGIAAAVREDADVIAAGELGDRDSVLAAVGAAETGHLVFALLDAAGVADAVERILDMFPAAGQERLRWRLANVLEAVSFQRLRPVPEGTGRKAEFELLALDERMRLVLREGRSLDLAEVLGWG